MKKDHRLADFLGRRNGQARERMGRVAVALSATHSPIPVARRVRVVGPHCSGKTFLAYCTANEGGAEVVHMSLVMCGMSGDVKAKFDEARAKGGPTLLLIEDGEMLSQPGLELVVQELIEQVDCGDNKQLVVVLNLLDDEVMNESLRARFDDRVEVYQPRD
ncbi:MAG: AAA family ATPase [Candidatus Obscuribacterales bacterium]|nr:AAA family ATPase [Candidatus Obscuribacterales bacterium]